MRAGDDLDLGTPHLQAGVGGGAIYSAQQLKPVAIPCPISKLVFRSTALAKYRNDWTRLMVIAKQEHSPNGSKGGRAILKHSIC